MKITIISDVPWGYGSPQISYLKSSLEARRIEVQLIVPCYSDRPLLSTSNAIQIITEGSPFTWEGMVSFGKRAANEVSIFAPDKIIVINPRSLTTLPFLKTKEVDVVYYGLEPIVDHARDFLRFIRLQTFHFQLGVFPNIERATADSEILGLSISQVRIVRNVSRLRESFSTSGDHKKVTYTGSLDPLWVDFEVLEEAAKSFPVEIWGHAMGKLPASLTNSYQGNLPHSEISMAFERAALSLIIWKPINFGTRNAAPNKFFEALSYGVPCVSYPYPHVAQTINKYGIGFISEEFNKGSLLKTLGNAYKLLSSNMFKEMKEMCLQLHKNHLNWEIESLPVIEEIIQN